MPTQITIPVVEASLVPPAVPSDPHGSVTGWIQQLGSNGREPVEKLWQRFGPRLIRYITVLLSRGRGLPVEEDAIASAVFFHLVQLARRGELAEARRDAFWQLMKAIAARRVIDERRHADRLKRDQHRIVLESSLRDLSDHGLWTLDQFPAADCPPDVVVMAADTLSQIAGLFDEQNREILLLRVDGHTVESIAKQIGKSVPTVERKLHMIRTVLQEWLSQNESGPTA